MKKRMCLMSAIVMGLSCLCSCSDDDDGWDATKSMTVYGRQYDVGSGVFWQSTPYVLRSTVPYVFEDTYEKEGKMVTDKVEGYKEGADTKEYGNFMLSLYERGMEYNEAISRVTGEGVCICCHLVSTEKDRLVPGKYVYGEDQAANTFIGYFSSDYNPEIGVTPAVITEGEVNVEENGDEYNVEFHCKNGSGGEIIGTYQGVIRQVKVSQQQAAIYSNVQLGGLMRYVHIVTTVFGSVSETKNPDTNVCPAFFSTTTGDCWTADAADKKKVDIALIWDRDNNYFRFESPIRMRAMLGHNDAYNFPCHTVYMQAPSSFTDEDYANLDKTGFNFEIEGEGETVKFGTEPFKSGYVFFKTGSGVKGVIRVNSFTPMGSKTESAFMGMIVSTMEVAPQLLLDIKSESNFQNPIMR